jgi:hypothetical protein
MPEMRRFSSCRPRLRCSISIPAIVYSGTHTPQRTTRAVEMNCSISSSARASSVSRRWTVHGCGRAATTATYAARRAATSRRVRARCRRSSGVGTGRCERSRCAALVCILRGCWQSTRPGFGRAFSFGSATCYPCQVRVAHEAPVYRAPFRCRCVLACSMRAISDGARHCVR